ncbi:hypothetical protein B5F12_04145 [Pseudoflavonifractor sp. An176]|uniref:DUF6076 domain-containing protein n=1 Tax=Pseudoflavonifractor sp. An176 TaxID=1965572 RepID=UPI000B3902D9|nr:DUF6076 domain-containing protein [Pseudoflavonifractor sp. An176]OUP65194.1 hypothetical protein B5F12_04145 [Pseudoflavonifractor sp. An176]
MNGDIVFYIHGSTIEYGGTLFDAGELTTDILNLGPREYASLHDQLQHIRSLARQYESTQDRSVWWELNCCLMELRSQMMKYQVFQVLLRDDEQFLNEAQQYTEQLTFIPDQEMDCPMTTPEQGGAAAVQEEENQSIPPQLLIYPGSRREKWLYYRKQMDRYQRYLEEVAAFNPTVHNFINFVLSKLEHNSSENYAAALYQFYNDKRLVEKLIVNPMGLEHAFYQKYDHCVVSYVPRELPDGKFAICQEHTTDSLQMLLKADYMTALNAGYNIRRCIVCKKYFLVRSGAHVLYCEGRCPLDERFTCRQYGSYEIQKELARDVPKIKAKITAFNRIRKDYQRGIITEEEMRRLKDAVRDRLFDALSSPDISNEDFERSIFSQHLYPICRVARQARPRGRPRKAKDGDGA